MSVPGCIVADPPVFEEPKRTPPFLDLAAADPSIFEILRGSPDDRVPINVPFRSEDAGDLLQAKLFLNYQTSTEDEQQSRIVTPGTFAERRTIIMEWTVPSVAQSTCQQLTLEVTHVSNLDDDNEFIDKTDVGLATWFVEIQADSTPATLDQCERIGEST